MKTKQNIYVGVTPNKYEIFKSVKEPTFKSHGHIYNAVIGEFKTLRGAKFMSLFGKGNPHCTTVDEAERLGKIYAK